MAEQPPAPTLGARDLAQMRSTAADWRNVPNHAAFCRLLAAYDAQAARLAAVEESLALLLDAVSGPPWVLPSGEYLSAHNLARELLGITAAAGEGAATERKRLRTPEDNIAFWRSDEAMDCD